MKVTKKKKMEEKIYAKFNYRCKHKVSQENFKKLILEYGDYCKKLSQFKGQTQNRGLKND